jgi:hypothetical protein
VPAKQLITTCLIALCAASVHADRLVFGSFKSPDNANNWSQKLSAMFARDMQVSRFDQQGTPMYRVSSLDLSKREYVALSRRAQGAGIRYWRLTQASDTVMNNLAESSREELAPSGARLVPPSPIVAPGAVASSTKVQQASAAARSTVAVEGEASDIPPHQISQQTLHKARNSEKQFDVGLQTRAFSDDGTYGQDQYQASISLELEYFSGWDNDTRSVTFKPFVRLDSADDERTHADIREFYYSRIADSWDLHLGAKRVFWGVTEFNHLVDIVNQTDLVENVDTEDKLGQPMLQLSLVRDWGILDVYALLGFRERTFAGEDGRLRLPLEVLDHATYESGAENKRVDAALRWSHYLGPIEIGLHHFSGTSRDPLLIAEVIADGSVALRPYYPVIDQTGLDAQAFYGDWAFKLETFSRSGYGDRYVAATLGFERTLVGILGSGADFGLVVEYMFDERDDEALNTLYEHDLALGGRLQFNDFSDTKALLGVIIDTDNDDLFVSLEASRRLSDTWLMSFEGRIFAGGENLSRATGVASLLDPDYKSAWLQQDDYLQLEFKKFL